MRILIVEDEQPNAVHLIHLLLKIDKTFQIEGPLASISACLEWFANSVPPDLILMDIQLADGLSFEIFQEISISTPVIFTTAYHQYTLKAFELNSIDYLLKPVLEERLIQALAKYKNLYEKPVFDILSANKMMEMLRVSMPKYKNRFLVKSGNRLVVVQADDIMAFYKDSLVLLLTKEGKKYALNTSLEELNSRLNPNDFFRINRQSIVNARYIKEMRQDGGQLVLKLSVSVNIPLAVSQRNVSTFKRWLDGEI